MLKLLNPGIKKMIVYLALAVVTLTVFGNVDQYAFINFDDHSYITQNIRVQSKMTVDGVRWAFAPQQDGNWIPLVWLSFMIDYLFFGGVAGGYHLTNLLLHILSVLLLFWLFNRMTRTIWPGAFAAALFALHPLHVESVVWVSERKDVLSAFFWMLTLCFYVFYTEKPVIKRYLFALFSFGLALMSKPMVVTLPFVMLLLDYWPLDRWKKDASLSLKNSNLRLIGEKIPFLILTVGVSILTYNAQHKAGAFMESVQFATRVSNALISYVVYLKKIFWPVDLAVFYPYELSLPLWQVWISGFILIVITVLVLYFIKKAPFLFVGWFWYLGTLVPVIGFVQVGIQAMADRYTYLPSIGISMMLAWGFPLLFPRADIRKKVLFPAGVACLAILAVLTWRQCSYWENSVTLFSHTIQVTKDNYRAYILRGLAYHDLRLYQRAIEDYDRAIHLKADFTDAYHHRGLAFNRLGHHQRAIDDYDRAIGLKADYAEVYNSRGAAYYNLGQYSRAIENYDRAIGLKADYAEAFNNRGAAYAKLGQYSRAIEEFGRVIGLNPNDGGGYANRARVYMLLEKKDLACRDAKMACALGRCEMLQESNSKKTCP